MADFSILLICKFRQYKVVNIANFVYCKKTRLGIKRSVKAWCTVRKGTAPKKREGPSFTVKPVAVAEWVARQTAEHEVGGSNPGIPPLLKHECGEGDWLLCWHYTPAKVSHQRCLRLRTVRIRQNPLWL